MNCLVSCQPFLLKAGDGSTAGAESNRYLILDDNVNRCVPLHIWSVGTRCYVKVLHHA